MELQRIMSETNSAAAEPAAPHRYTAAMAADIEARWQDFWEARGHVRGAQPTGDLAGDPALAARPKKFIMDMFPYPSGAGLHVGHPLGYIATDVFARHQRMTGHNVLHTLGFDAFGLPAEQYAVQTGTHPRVIHRGEHGEHEAPAAPAGPGPRQAPLVRDDRPGVLQLDPVDLPADLQLLVRRRTPTGRAPDRRAGRAVRGRGARRRPTAAPGARWTPSSAPTCWARTAWRTPPTRRSTGAPGWAPCWPTRRSPPTAAPSAATSRCSSASCASGTCASPPTPTGCWTTWTRWTGPRPSSCSSATGSGAARARASTSRSATRGAITVFTTRPDTLFGATYMVLAPSTSWSRRSCPRAWPEGTHDGVDRRPRDPGRRRRRVPQAGRRQVGRRAAGRGQGQDRRLHRRVRDQPGQRRAGAGVHRRLRPDGLRHRRDHGRARRTTAATSRSRGPSSCRCAASSSRPTAAAPTRRRGTTRSLVRREDRQLRRRRDLPGRPGRRRRQGHDHRLAGRARHRRGHRQLPPARLAVQPPALLGRALPDRLRRGRRRHSLPESMLPLELPEVDDYIAAHLRPGRRRHQAGDAAVPQRGLGERRRWTWATARRQALPPRDQHHAQLGGFLLVRAALPGPGQQRALVDPAIEQYWMGPREGTAARRRRPVRRRRRARRAAPAVRALLVQGAVRPGARLVAPSRSTSCSTRA